MSVRRSRIPVVLVLANYVLALTVGGNLHVHTPPRCPRTTGTCCSHVALDTADCPADHSADLSCCHPDQIGERKGGPSCSYHSGRCPVCQFLAQKPIPDRPIESVVCAGATCDLVIVEPVRRAAPIPHTHSIRGPPSVA